MGRSGFHPEEGTVYDEKLIPNQFREALGLKRRDEPDRQNPAGDSPLYDTIIEDDETLRESSPTAGATVEQSPVSELERPGTPERERGAGARDKAPSKETSASSTPRQHAEALRQTSDDRGRKADALGEILDSLDEWGLWAKRQYALFAGKDPPLICLEHVSPQSLRVWDKLNCIHPEQTQELKDLLRRRAQLYEGSYSDSEDMSSHRDDGRIFESRLAALRRTADDMSIAYERSRALLELCLKRIKKDKRPPVDPSQIVRLPDSLRGFGHRATLNALIMKFMRHLIESALPYLRYQNHVNMGFAADRPESVEIESTLSHAGSDNDSSWADVQGSFFEDDYLPQSGSK